MELLPREIWILIIEEHLYRRGWQLALSATSSFFRSVAQPILYKHVRVSTYVPRKSPTLTTFARTLGEHPEFGAYVHSLEINSYDGPGDCYAGHPVLSKPGLLPQLQKLKLIQFRVQDDFCAALFSHQFPRLTTLEFDTCPVSIPISKVDVQPESGSLFSSIIINHPYAIDPVYWSAVTHPGIRELMVYSETNVEFLNATISDLMRQGHTRMLTKLEIDCTRFPPNIIPFLISSPEIRNLTLGFGPSPGNDPPFMSSLPMSAIPLLEEFRGWSEFARILVPGRPVHTLHVFLNGSTPADLCLALELSTTPITELTLTNFGRFDYGSFLQYAPISILRFGWYISIKAAILSCVPAISRLSNLRTITGGFLSEETSPIETRSDRQEIVQELSDACPSIGEFNFLNERWLARKQGGWERYFST